MQDRLRPRFQRPRGSVPASHVRKRILAWPGRVLAVARRPPIFALAAFFLVGAVLRVWLFIQWRPAFLGFPDSSIYIVLPQPGQTIYVDAFHIGGYGEFLRLMHSIRPHLSFAIFVQHGLGVASGLLLFGAVRRAGVRDWVAVVPAAVIFLSGSEIYVEHAALSEALFIFLVDAALYAMVRTWRGNWSWALLAGALLGAAATVRTVGLPLAVILAFVGLVAVRSAWRDRLLRLVLMLFAVAVPVGIYFSEQSRVTGFGGLTTPFGYFDLYGRVAEFADCSTFQPPKGTSILCPTIPVSQRQGPGFWEFAGSSPAVAAFGNPDENQPKPGDNAKLRSFALAAILGQPFDYLQYVGRDLVRIVDPSFSSSPYPAIGNQGYGGLPEDQLDSYFDVHWTANAFRLMSGYYPGDGLVQRDVSQLNQYERDTRLEGPLMAVLLLLALLAPLVGRGPERRAAILFGTATFVLLAAPSFVAHYEYRFVIPAFGPLAATSAIGVRALLPHGQSVRNHVLARVRRNM